jgi:hypothetical protein
MYYSYVEIEYIATSFSPARTDLALKLLKEYYNYSPISTYTEISRYFRETIVTVKLSIYRKQERNT